MQNSKRANPFKTGAMEQCDFFSLGSMSTAKKNVTSDEKPLQFNRVLCFRSKSEFNVSESRTKR